MVGATSCLIELFIICSCLNGLQKKLISILLCWVLWKREICLEFRDINKTFKSHLKWADFVTARSYRTRNSMETARACFIFSQKYLWIYFYGFVTGFVRYESQTKLSACNALSVTSTFKKYFNCWTTKIYKQNIFNILQNNLLVKKKKNIFKRFVTFSGK